MVNMKHTGRLVSQEKPSSIRKEKVVGYIRISSKEQEKGFGKESQLNAIKAACERGDAELAHVFTDSAISGTEKGLDSREAFFAMLKYCESEKIHLVVVLDLSRLWREDVVKYVVKKEFLKRSIQLLSLNQPQYRLDTTDPSEFLISSLMETIATFEKMTMMQKLNAGRIAKLKSGGFSGGGIPLGFVTKDKELVPYEEEMNIVRYIFRKKKSGWSTYKIARTLRDNKVPGKHGGQIMPSTVQKVLRSKIYKGYLKYAGKLYLSALGKVI